MTGTQINLDRATIALERAEGSVFERFFHAFYPAIAGDEFIPLGGTGDGGGDAFQGEAIYAGKQSGCFYQASVTDDYRSKIRHTVKRLIESHRTPTTVIYVTSKIIKFIDREENELSNELGCNIKIRDRAYLTVHMNDSHGARAAFETFLAPKLSFLRSIGGHDGSIRSQITSSPAIYVFLRQELARRQGRSGLVNALADGLITWALEGTDPDQGLFLTESEIVQKIEGAVPAARTVLRGAIPNRLKHLAKELSSATRPVRWHPKKDQYCLSYEHRKNIEDDNAEDEALRLAVVDSFRTRMAGKFGTTLTIDQINTAVDVSLLSLNRTFEAEGVELASFILSQQPESSPNTIADHVDACLVERNTKQVEFAQLKEAILENLWGAFYDSTHEERLYFAKLSATYTLLFCLNTEPRIVEYFQNMASDFYLYVGSDIIVRVLSEKYLRAEDQMMTNTLRIIGDAGGKIALTDQVLDEVHSHLEAADYEYRNKYEGVELSIDLAIARNSDRILIRAYYYSRLSPPAGVQGPSDWSEFIEQICGYDDLHGSDGREQIMRFLQAKFGMEYVTEEEVASLCDPFEVERLSTDLQQEKKDPRLARNDAEMTLAVYGRRKHLRESSSVSEFGYRTWWLTAESRILRHTENLVSQYHARYMMRPEFILNFITLLPSTAVVKRTYRGIFPSVLGIQLARRVSKTEIQSVLDRMHVAQKLEPARRTAEISMLSNKLKGDFVKQYDHRFGELQRG